MQIRWSGNGLARLTAATEKLAGPQKVTALRRALNHTGGKVTTRTKRELSQQIGAPQTAIMKYGKVKPKLATSSNLEFQVVSNGGPIPLKHFKARQTRKGVTASPWNNRKTYRSAFVVATAGGHAFWRDGKTRLPITRIAGPNVPKEMVKDQVAEAFRSLVSSDLPPRVEHEVRRLTDGVLS